MVPRKLKIKALRAQLGLTQNDVATEMGLAVSTYVAKENDPGRLTVYQLNRLMAILGVSKIDHLDVGFVEDACDLVETTHE